MQRGQLLVFVLCLLCCQVTGAGLPSGLSYDPADYLEVYPDPRDPAVLRGRTPLHFALIQSLGGQFDGSGAVAGVKVALDRINNDTTLLPGYTLHYILADGMCERAEGIDMFFSQIFREPTIMAVVGTGCSSSTEPTAEVSHYYNISQISCLSSSPSLRNRERFPYYFQLLTGEETMAFAYYGAIKEYRWKRVAIVAQDETVFTVAVERMKVLLDRDGVEYSTKIFSTDAGISDLGDNPFDESARIYLYFMYSVNARPLICEAYRRNIGAPKHIFLLPGWYSRMWLEGENENLTCTREQREKVLVSSLAFLNTVFLDPATAADLKTDTGNITGSEFLEAEKPYVNQPPLNLTDLNLQYSQYCHDAAWTLAFALSNTLKSLANETLNSEIAEAFNVTPPFGLEDFSYKSDRLVDVIFQHLESTSFDGISGPVSFGDQGIRPVTELIVFQYRKVVDAATGATFLNFADSEIGRVIPSGTDDYNFRYGPQESDDTVWNGVIPYDGVPLKQIVTFYIPITVIFIIAACAGIVFAVVCLIFNLTFRKSKLVKLASSQLNYLIGIGAIILYLNMVLFVIPSTDPDVVAVLCNITPWLTAIGYSLCYGTILMKMARVYYIFSNPSANRKGVQDWMLIVGVALMVAIDLTILVLYVVVEGARGKLEAKLVPFRENSEEIQGEQDIITVNCVYICDSTARSIFLGVLYGYKMVLQVIALVLAFSIRKVKVKGLDDAKSVGASIYVTSIVLAVIIVGTYSLKDIINAFASLVCAGFFIGTTVILILVFVPLMVGLYKDPKGENIFSKSSGTSTNLNLTATKQAAEIEMLRSRIKQLEAELEGGKQTPSTPKGFMVINPGLGSGTIAAVLEDSNMVTTKNGQDFHGTIWDAPGNGKVTNGNHN